MKSPLWRDTPLPGTLPNNEAGRVVTKNELIYIEQKLEVLRKALAAIFLMQAGQQVRVDFEDLFGINVSPSSVLGANGQPLGVLEDKGN